MLKYLLLVMVFVFSSNTASADECGWNSDHTYYGCDGFYSGAAVGGSAPLLGDSLESNPAALPTDPTPLGLEGIYTNRASPSNSPKFSVSTIKGFDGIGFGIGSWTENTFGAPDFDTHFLASPFFTEYKNYQTNPASVLGLRLGTTILLPKGPLPRGIRISVGGSGGISRAKGDWSPQTGILLRIYGLGLGYSQSFERLSVILPRVKIASFSAGLPVGPLYLGYSHIVMSSSVNKNNTNIYGIRWIGDRFTLHAGVKVQKDHRNATDSWIRGGIQRKLGSRIGVGYDFGQYRQSHSASLQIYL